MVFDPSSDMTLPDSLDALQELRDRQADDAALDAKYSDPSVLRGEQEKLTQALYTRSSEGEPLTIEQQEANTRQFDDIYAGDIDFILPEITDAVRDNFTGSGDLDGSIYQALIASDIPEENREDLADAIAEYVDPRITSIRIQEQLDSESGITVKFGMNASYINAFLGSNRHIDFNDAANTLNVGDSLKFGSDSTSLLRNDTTIGELNEDAMDLNEIAGREFTESRYTPLINAHIPENGMVTDPLHDISPEQVEEISNGYLEGVDIVEAMVDVLGSDHEAVMQAQDLDNPSNIKERRAQMYEDFSVASENKVDENNTGGDTFTNLISENYTRILGQDGEVDTKTSLILASQISANKVIEGKHTFTRTPEFEDAYDRILIGSENPEQMQADLMLIYTTVNRAEGIRGKSRQNESYRQRRNAEQKALFLESEFQNIQRLMVEQNSELQIQPGVDDVYAELESKSQGGEVFTAGVLDSGSESHEATNQQT